MKSSILIFCLVYVFQVQNLLANNPQAKTDVAVLLQTEKQEYRHPTDAIRIQLSTLVSDEQLERIAIELDSIDITEMFSLEDMVAIFEPTEALSTGKHFIRLVEYLDETTIVVMGSWSFTVKPIETITEYSFAADTQLMTNYRLADKNIGSPSPNKYQGQASTQIGFSVSSGEWQTEGQFDLFYNSDKSSRVNGRSIDNGEFLFSVGNQYINAHIGHQSIGITSLVMENFRRRGVSIEGSLESINSNFSGFSLSSANISGFGGGLGVSDPGQRVDGMVFESVPLGDDPNLLYITGTWLQGQTSNPDNFVSEIGDPESGGAQGDAWALSGQSAFFDEKMQLRFEYAVTDFDFNQADDINSEQDNAYNFSSNYSDSTESGLAWNTGFSTNKIGTFFHSLGNQALASDKKLNNIFAGLQWTSYGVQVSFEQQQDNVEKIDLIPRIETDISNISFNWSPVMENKESWAGTPSFSLGFANQDQLQTFTPTGFSFAKADNTINNWQFSASFAYQTNSWGISLTNSNFEDATQIQNDSDTVSFGLFSSLLFGDYLSVSPNISYNQTEDLITGISSTAVTYSLQSSWAIIPDELNAAFDINMNQNQTSDRLLNGDNLAANLSVNWLVREPTSNSFGFQVDLSAAYNDFEDNIFMTNSLEAYQIFLNFTATLPTRMGQAE